MACYNEYEYYYWFVQWNALFLISFNQVLQKEIGPGFDSLRRD